MIIISPYAKQRRNGKINPKNYPYWEELLQMLSDECDIIQVGMNNEIQMVDDFRTNLSITELSDLISKCKTWISIDSFFQHLGWYVGKQGVVIFSQSDPKIFGHNENINLLKSRNYLRENQFWNWEDVEYKIDSFIECKIIFDIVIKIIQ